MEREIIMIIKVFYTFLLFLEIMVVIYIVVNMLFRVKSINHYFHEFLEPLLGPLEKISKKSIMYMPIIELSPILLLIVLLYFEQILYKFL